MVYIGNIFTLAEQLSEDEELLLKYGGDWDTKITATDKIEKQGGDLKITRESGTIVIVDPPHVKCIIKQGRFL